MTNKIKTHIIKSLKIYTLTFKNQKFWYNKKRNKLILMNIYFKLNNLKINKKKEFMHLKLGFFQSLSKFSRHYVECHI